MMKRLLMLVLFLSLPLACDDSSSGSGDIQFYVEPEWTITNGIPAGDNEEDMRDGWNATYEKFVISLGNVYVTKSDSDKIYSSDKNYIVDLKNAPQGGLVVASFSNVSAGHWDRVGYEIPAATSSSEKLGEVSDEEFNLMKDEGLSTHLRIVLTKEEGQTCPYDINGSDPIDPNRPCFDEPSVVLDWQLAFPAKAEGCQTPSETGVTVPDGGSIQAKLTIHADHFFFTAFRHTDVYRMAQHIIDADLNHDGEITLEELDQVPISVLDPTVFDLSTIPDAENLNTLKDYIRWAAITLPHFQGDGGCPERTAL